MDPVALWNFFKHETLDAEQESIGKCPATRQNFIVLETLEAKNVCHMVQLNANQGLCHFLVNRAWTLLKGDKEKIIRNISEEVEGLL